MLSRISLDPFASICQFTLNSSCIQSADAVGIQCVFMSSFMASTCLLHLSAILHLSDSDILGLFSSAIMILAFSSSYPISFL